MPKYQFKMVSKERRDIMYKLTILVLVLAFVDFSMTAIALVKYPDDISEANPVVNKFIDDFGLMPGLFGSMLVLLFLVFLGFNLSIKSDMGFWVVLVIFAARVLLNLIVIINNIGVIYSVV